ncbi:toll/interleukin-1 receptor domain-containing protein [Pyxidicoccus xibeiensis]|uniref:toll/interleukin-1 receptor domain-containing protein n=1 Tax=Pyxidicoccus xibeiensis TaxID=2906759 RepID=UPI0020A6EB64|nr:toll/interleukin-1 receptor domain-containing protein [Pyxidicoccus xibeiensis]MCP3139247.1 toll/interleukin-1 receptor domain-containing protein [Pyxidicoccus xibeiensis]
MDTGSVGRRYRAFISYSHKDSHYARRLHRELETYRVPRDLRARPGLAEVLPERLGPLFLDRLELPAAADLSATIQEALVRSDSLIVLCSPHAARSRYVDAEVRYFKELGREARILTLIVPGGAGPAALPEELFPPTLLARYGPDGQPTGERVEPLAADLRPEGDGDRAGLLKVVAALLGLGLGVLWDRDALEQRRLVRRYRFVAGTMALLTLVSLTATWAALDYRDRAERNFEQSVSIASGILEQTGRLVNHFGVPRDVVATMLTEAEARFHTLARDGSNSRKLSLSLMQIQTGFSDHYQLIGDTGAQLRSAEQARELARVASEQWPDDVDVLRILANAHERVGFAYLGRNDTAAALAAYEQCAQVRQRVTELMPGNGDRVRAVGIARVNIGEALRAAGRHDDALVEYEAALAAFEQAKALHADARLILLGQATVLQRMAIVHRHMGRWEESRKRYQRAMAVFDELREHEPTQLGHRVAQAEIWSDLGKLEVEQERYAEAAAAFQRACDMTEQLLKADGTSLTFRVSALWCQFRRGEVEALQENPAEALAKFRQALDINEALLAKDPKSSLRQKEAAVIRTRLGSVLAKLGRHAEAEAYLKEADGILQDLHGSDSGNREWLLLGAENDRICGEVLALLKKPEEARQRLERAVARGGTLVGREPWSVYHQRELAEHRLALADFELAQGQGEQARLRFGQVLEAAKRAQADAPHPEWARFEARARAGLEPRTAKK